VFFDRNSEEWTAEEPVVEAVVDVGVGAFAGTVASPAKLPVRLPGYSAFLTRPAVLSPLHEVHGPLAWSYPFAF